MRKRWVILITMISMLFIAVTAVGPMMSNVEKPQYGIVKSQGSMEVRHYDPMLIAVVQMSGTRSEALGDGFRLLADYIFGNNTVSQSIAMTAPVQQQSMEDDWLVSFVMPAEYTLETLPKPMNHRVILKEVEAKTFAVVRFSGMNSDKNLQLHEKQLMEYISSQDLEVIGVPQYAFYNPPWTLPFMRRNEVMIEIQ